jgi:phosphotransferase system IIB component
MTGEMEAELRGIESISDVGYLLTRLRLAKRRNEAEIKEAILERLKRIGVLKEGKEYDGTDVGNLRDYVNKILGTQFP